MKQKTMLSNPSRASHSEQGNILIGMVIGLVIGLGVALATAYFIEKNPPVEKPNVRAPEIPLTPKINQDGSVTNEAQDPNVPMQGKQKTVEAPSDTSATPTAVDNPPPAAPVADTKPTSTYYIQVGAFNDKSSADANKAQLAMQGMQAKVSETKKDDQTVWRVRLGPFSSLQDMENDKNNLDNAGISYSVIKVNK
jgi:cell division protein FtsN